MFTTRLSSKIQETFGPEAGEDLVDWMRSIDDRHSQLRELHELTTSRFESRLGEAKAELRTEIAELRTEMRLGFSDTRTAMAALESRMYQGNLELTNRVEQRITETSDRLEERITNATNRLDQHILLVMKWTVGLWATTLVMLTAAIFSWLNLR